MSSQLPLPLRIPVWIPTLTLAGARGALGVSEDEVRGMINDGEIGWAWNIATRGAARVELRILAAALPDLTQPPDLALDSVVRLVYGPQRPWVWGKDFYRAWNCDSGHLFNLLKDRSIKILPKTDWRRGRGGSPCVTWNSAVEFLKNRRVR